MVLVVKIDQHPFEPHSLGKITVAAPASARTQATAVATGSDAVVPILRVVLPIAALVALAAFTWRLLAVVGRGRHLQASSPHSPREASSDGF
jgi:hypothetical protein